MQVISVLKAIFAEKLTRVYKNIIIIKVFKQKLGKGISVKVLILSCNTGQGHNAAGKALLEEFRTRGIPCDMQDALAFAGQRASRVVSNTYINIAVKTPNIFGLMYKAGNSISSNRRKSPVYYANKAYAAQMADFIEQNGYDTVLCPHLFPAEALTYIRHIRPDFSARCYAVATDYACIPFWEETRMDRYFIPHRELAAEFERKGIAAERLCPTGIPVSSRFAQKRQQSEARAELGHSTQGKEYLVIGGSMGFGDVKTLAAGLADRISGQDRIIIMGGNNERLKQELRAGFSHDARVQVLDFTDQVSLYMDACDVLFTKPGGLTSTEAAAKRVAMIHTAPIPGCETINAEFFASRGMSVRCMTAEDAVESGIRLAEDPLRREAMRLAQEREINAFAARDIVDEVLRTE